MPKKTRKRKKEKSWKINLCKENREKGPHEWEAWGNN